jgi:hypothetical protein
MVVPPLDGGGTVVCGIEVVICISDELLSSTLPFARSAVWAFFIAFLTSGVTTFTLSNHVTVQFLPSLSQ